MKSGKWMILAIALVLVALLLFPACAKSTPEATTSGSAQATVTQVPGKTSAKPVEQPRSGGILKIITAAKLAAFDAPPECMGPMGPNVIHPIWDTLFTYDLNGNILPGLATPDISADGKTWTLTLKKGVKFHDGTDFTAEAIKYHIQNFKFSPARFQYIASMDILDPYTIRFNLSKPDNNLIHNLGGSLWAAINSPTALQKPPTSPENKQKEHVMGTGPFKFLEWKRDVSLKTVKNDNYWDKGKPYLDGVQFNFMADATTALMSFEAGEGQVITNLTPTNAADLAAKGYNIQSCITQINVLCPDSKNADSPFADKRVRQAVEYAIDKQGIVKSFGYGFWAAQYQPVPPDKTEAYVPTSENRLYNPAKAKQLLAEAGYPNGFDTSINAVSTEDKDLLATIQSNLKSVGIRAKINLSDNAKFQEDGRLGWNNGLRYFSFAVDINTVATYTTTYGPEISGHTGAMARPKNMIDAVVQARTEPNRAKVKELLQVVTKTVNDEALTISLWTNQGIAAMQKSVHNLNINSIDTHRFYGTLSDHSYLPDVWLGE